MDTREMARENRIWQWEEIMRKREESGESIKAYCKSLGIHENVYYYWQRKLREEACGGIAASRSAPSEREAVRSGFVAIRELPEERGLGWLAGGETGHLCAEIAGVKITVNGSYPVEKLTCVLRELVRG